MRVDTREKEQVREEEEKETIYSAANVILESLWHLFWCMVVLLGPPLILIGLGFEPLVVGVLWVLGVWIANGTAHR